MMLTLTDDEVHLWLADCSDFSSVQVLADCEELLDESEIIRAQRFLFSEHRQRFLLTRGLIRNVLSSYVTTIRPQSWVFENNQYGRPAIVKPQLSRTLHFTISHSRDIVAIAVAAVAEVGVDAEVRKSERPLYKIAKRFFSEQEYADLRSLTPALQEQRFYDLWSLKEAYIKACGMGLAIPLRQFSFNLDEEGSIAISFDAQRNDNPALWEFWQFQVWNHATIALALKSLFVRDGARLITRRLLGLEDFEDFEIALARSTRNS